MYSKTCSHYSSTVEPPEQKLPEQRVYAAVLKFPFLFLMVGKDYKEFSILAENAYGFIKTTYFQSIAHTRSHEGTEGTWRIFLAGSETSLKTAVPGDVQPAREAQRQRMARG